MRFLLTLILAISAASAQAATFNISGDNFTDDQIIVGDVYLFYGGNWIYLSTRGYINGSWTSAIGNGDDLEIYGKAGDDMIMMVNSADGNYAVAGDLEIRPVQQISLSSVTIDGGLGEDEIYGSDQNDVIFGGDDYDFLFGRQGDDLIVGTDGTCLAPGLTDYDDCCAELDDEDECEGDAGQDRIVCAKSADGGANTDGCATFAPTSCEVDLCD